jgi:O-antigen ligase
MNEPTRAGWTDRAASALLCAFVFSLPWEKSVDVPGVGTISRLLGMLAFAAVAAGIIQRRQPRRPNLALVLAAVYVVWNALTWFWSYSPDATAARAFTFVQLLGMAWMIWESCRTPERDLWIIRAYVLGTIPSSAYAFVRYFQGQQTYWRRYAAGGFDPNDFGLTLALSIPLGLYLAGRSRGPARWLWRGALAMAIFAILLSASRTALVVSSLGFILALATWRGSDRSHNVWSTLLFCLLLVGAWRLAPSASRERLATLPSELATGTLAKRTRIWKSGLKALKQRPIVGVGAGAFPQAVRPWIGTPPSAGHEYVAHNTFLSVLVESGAIGFGLFGLMLATLALFVWILPSPERALWSVMLAVWAVGVCTLTWEHRKPAWLLFSLILTAWARSAGPAHTRNDPDR